MLPADTPDFEGKGESAPVPYFFQNLAEAEYMVTLYQYMRLIGYPADKISMLTTYNGQKALLRDVAERRCAHHPAFGMPHQVIVFPTLSGSALHQQHSGHRTVAVFLHHDALGTVLCCSRGCLSTLPFG